jgi:transcriptional regulator with XRE-family HTH domain
VAADFPGCDHVRMTTSTVNERLRRAMYRAGLNVETLAETAGVSPKTAHRWLSGDVTPYPRTRYRVAAVLHEDEAYLWPGAVNGASLSGAELAATWPRRSDVPGHLWTDLLRAAEHDIDVLAFAGLFLTEDHPAWLPILADKAASGARVRLLLGDPDGAQLAARDREYRIGGGVAGRVTAVLAHYRQLGGAAEMRLHDTPLYNSIYRFDDEMLINIHAYGILAARTPVMHLRRADGAFFNTYIESFERAWASARALRPEEAGMP